MSQEWFIDVKRTVHTCTCHKNSSYKNSSCTSQEQFIHVTRTGHSCHKNSSYTSQEQVIHVTRIVHTRHKNSLYTPQEQVIHVTRIVHTLHKNVLTCHKNSSYMSQEQFIHITRTVHTHHKKTVPISQERFLLFIHSFIPDIYIAPLQEHIEERKILSLLVVRFRFTSSRLLRIIRMMT